MMQRITIALLLIAFYVSAQDAPKKDVNLETLADELFGFQNLDLNYQDLYENMAQLLSNPISLNRATADELRFLNLLSEQQIQSLILYRRENGDLLSVYELQAIPGFNIETAQKIIPFVNVESSLPGKKLWERIRKEENNYLIIRHGRTLETKEGFKKHTTESSRFEGSNGDLYLRFRTSRPGDFSFGITIDNDAGEPVRVNRDRRQYGFDFYSFHGQVLNKKNLSNLILGDYQTQFGQGLILGGSYGYGKGAETVATVRRSNLGFLPYTSANEFGYKRGVAATYKVFRNAELSFFYSNTKGDATLLNDSLGQTSASSFQTTGLHRNDKELKARHQIGEQNVGLVASYRKNQIDVGAIFNAIDFSEPIRPKLRPYNQFEFTGSRVRNIGAYLNYTIYNVTFFSEAAHTLNNGNGITAGLLGSLTTKLDVALHVRHYDRNFLSLRSSAFAESSEPQNENGIYWGWKYQLTRRVSASGYVDLFKFPWLRFGNYAPSEGHEILFRLNYQPTKKSLLYFQMRQEVKSKNVSSEKSANQFLAAEGTKRSYCVNMEYPVTPALKLKTRAQFSSYVINDVYTNGMALVQDISLDLGRVALVGRYALFDTDDFENRQYIYERDVWLAYSLPAYSGSGIRNYIMAEYTFSKRISFWIRLATTRYTDRDKIGSGADAIHSDTKRDLRIQARIKF